MTISAGVIHPFAKAEFGTKNKLTRITIPQRLDLSSSILF